MTVPGYTDSELQRAAELSPAVARYLKFQAKKDSLSEQRQMAWLTAAIDTLLAKASPRDISYTWSMAADSLLQKAWATVGFEKLPASLLALGKLGAGELNLSSDVDLVIVAQPSATAEITRKLKEFHAQFYDADTGVNILRLDFDLRPGGRFGPLIPTMGQLTDYYWNQGETWERLAWVRARPVCGDAALTEEILQAMTSFCYRRYLDFSVIEDLKLLRKRIHASLSVPEDQIHLKLGAGGIRDLELFVHSLLIIHGGRRPEIRSRSTSQAIKNLTHADLLKVGDANFLESTYWRLREFENSVQAYEDLQTHILQLGPNHPIISKPQQEECIELCKKADQFVATLLGPVRKDETKWPEKPEDQITWLTSKGFSEDVVQSTWPLLESATAISTKSERDESFRREFLVQFVDALAEISLDRNLGLQTLLEFVKSVRAKSTFFSMLLREPRLIKDLSYLFSVSPYLGQLISSRPELLDSFLYQRMGPPSSDWDNYLEELVERRQISELVASAQFLRSMDIDRFGSALTSTADEIVIGLLSRLKQELPSTLQMFALGKWGGSELGIRSDLDFMLICEGEPTETDHRLARRLISRLTESHRGGRIYAVDLRLRPSGQSGPLLVSHRHLTEYIRDKAEAWQRQSYLRARAIGPTEIDLRGAAMARPLSDTDLESLKDIRSKLLKTNSETQIDLKYSAGGLIPVEFTAQIAMLRGQILDGPPDTLGMIRLLTARNSDWQKRGNQVLADYQYLRSLEQLHQLTSLQSGSILNPQDGQFQRLAMILKTSTDDLESQIQDRLARAAKLLTELDPLL